MKYVDGFVVAVPADKKDAYREMAAKAAPLFKEFGALRIVECWASDVPDGKVTDFRMAVKAEENEDIDVLDFRVCYNGEWYNTRFVPAALVEAILNSPRVADVHKEQLQKMIVRKGELSFYDIFTLARAESTS
ncbi:YlaC family protein [Enterobacter hormaechei subsp. steigerwaltii]|nr:YlaC family protein [Enterobacter hormaechei subsp. steigerwaltii]